MRAIPAAFAALLLACSAGSHAAESSKAQACAQEAQGKTDKAFAKARDGKRWASWSPLERNAARIAAGEGRRPSWAALSPEAAARELDASRRRLADDREMAAAYGAEANASSGRVRVAALERQAFWNAMAAIDSTGSSFSACMGRKAKHSAR